MSDSGSFSHSSYRATSRPPSRLGGRLISTAPDRWRASMSRSPSSEGDRGTSSTPFSPPCATPPPRHVRSSSSRCATTRRAPSECSFSVTRAGRRLGSHLLCRLGWSNSGCIDARRARGFHTLRPCASGSVHGWIHRFPGSGISHRPVPLLSFPVCARPGRATKRSSRTRSRDLRRFEAVSGFRTVWVSEAVSDSVGRMTA